MGHDDVSPFGDALHRLNYLTVMSAVTGSAESTRKCREGPRLCKNEYLYDAANGLLGLHAIIFVIWPL